MSGSLLDERPPPIPYELRIGVTGHCELECQEEVAEVVRGIIARDVVTLLEAASADPFGPHGSEQPAGSAFFRSFTFVLAPVTRLVCPLLGWPVVPHTPRTPPAEARTPLDLTVVTSLAPGSDQIVAAAVCACVRNPEARNRYLEAVLPLPPDAYEASFEQDADRARFRGLLALDRGRLGTHPDPTIVHPDGTNAAERSAAFRAAGRRVVDSCEIVVAVWDPKRPPEPGGTEETLRYAIDRGRPVLWLDPSELARGVRLLRPRPADAPQDPGSPPGLLAGPPPTRAKELSLDFHRLAAYNRDAALDPAAYRRAVAAERERFRAAARPTLPGWIADVAERDLLPRFVRADLLATRYHELRNFVNALLPAISVFALSLIAFQILFLPALHTLAAVEILLVVVGLVSYRLSVREAWHEKWLSDRHLAERLRDLAYTFALEADPGDEARATPAERTANLLPFYSPTNAWFASPLARLAGRARRARPPDFDPADHVGALRKLIREAWIEPQAAYHAVSEHHARGKARVSRRAAAVTIAAVLVVATAHALGVGHGDHDGAPLLGRVDLWIALLTLLIPAWGAAFQVIDAIEDHPRVADRAGRMAGLLRGLAEQLRSVDSLGALRRLAGDARRIIELESHEHAESLRGRFVRFHG